MVSVTHGRPAMISKQLAVAVPLPLAATSSLDGHDDADRVTFFVKSVLLYEIINRIMVDLYGTSVSRSRRKEQLSDSGLEDAEDDDLDMVVRLDRCLGKWERRLPDHLRWCKLQSITNEIHRRQTVILRMRYVGHGRGYHYQISKVANASPATCTLACCSCAQFSHVSACLSLPSTLHTQTRACKPVSSSKAPCFACRRHKPPLRILYSIKHMTGASGFSQHGGTGCTMCTPQPPF